MDRNEWIMCNMDRNELIRKKMQEHYKCMLELYPADRIVGVFLQGSQNYNMDDVYSDVDTKCLIVPSVDEIVLAKQPVSVTHCIVDGKLVYTEEEKMGAEHCDAKDIRLYWKTLLKANINFVEILFTDHYIINAMYEDFWNEILSMREAIARVNPLAAIKAMMGMVSEKYFALTHRYPSRVEWLDKFGYDPKQLHHLIRIYYFMHVYFYGKDMFSYNDLVKSKHVLPAEAKNIKDIKRLGCGDLECAQKQADSFFELAKKIYEEAKLDYDGKDNEEIKNKMFDIMAEIVKLSIRKELE